MTEDTTPAEPLDTNAIRAKLAAHNFLHRDFALDLCDEVDRVRAALAFHTANTTTGSGASAVGVGAAPAEPTHRFARYDYTPGGCQHETGRFTTDYKVCGKQRADPVHVQQPAEPCDDGCCKNSPCDFQEDNPVHVQRDERAERGDGGRDPHCALPHPHGRSNRCAGD